MSGQEAEREPLATGREENPFAAPATGEKAFQRGDVDGATDYEDERNKYLRRETSIKAVGVLFMICGVLCLFVLGCLIFTAVMQELMGTEGKPAFEQSYLLGTGVFSLVLAVVYFWGGISLYRLRSEGRIICSVMLLIGFSTLNSITVITSVILLSILWLYPSSRIFRADYRTVIVLSTPQIKGKLSLFMKCFLCFLLLATVASLVSSYLTKY